MGKRTLSKKRKKVTRDAVSVLEECLRAILNVLVSGYMLLLIVIMPFYFQEGYTHIGSDKSVFFRTCSLYATGIILPVSAVCLVCGIIRLSREVSEENREESGSRALAKRERGGAGSPTSTKEKRIGQVNWVGQARRVIKKVSFSTTDYFALGYGGSVLLSYACTPYKGTALWGTSGWYMGTMTQLFLVGIYFAVSRLCKGVNRMIYLFLPVSAVIFVLGILNRFDVWLLTMENSGRPDFISTIGNINWYCGYMTCVLFLGVGMFWLEEGEKKWKEILLAAYCFIGFATAVTQGSDSGLFALAILFWVLFALSAREAGENRNRWKRFWQMILLFAGACEMIWILQIGFPERMNYVSGSMNLLTTGAIPHLMVLLAVGMLGVSRLQSHHPEWDRAAVKIYRRLAGILCIIVPVAGLLFIGMIVWNTMYPGSLGVWSDYSVFTFDAEWGSKRGATWMAGIQCFADQNLLHKLVGVGPDCMAEYLYSGANEELLRSVRKVFETARLTNAHNEWLTILIGSGLLGMGCFAGIMVSSIIRGLKAYRNSVIPCVCALCVLAYTCNNIWSFQQSMSVATIFVILGMGENRIQSEDSGA